MTKRVRNILWNLKMYVVANRLLGCQYKKKMFSLINYFTLCHCNNSKVISFSLVRVWSNCFGWKYNCGEYKSRSIFMALSSTWYA